MNNIPSGTLLQCPNPDCVKLSRRGQPVKQVLGRLLDDGRLLVLRFADGTTLINAATYQLICGCGFGFSISGTVVAETTPPM